MTNEQKLREALRWILECAEARNTDKKARTVNLEFSRLTLDMWQERAHEALSPKSQTSDKATLLTDAYLKEIYEEHKTEGLDDFSHYCYLVVNLKVFARQLERTLHAKERELEECKEALAAHVEVTNAAWRRTEEQRSRADSLQAELAATLQSESSADGRVEGRYSEGIMADGACILYDGQPVPIEDVVARLNTLPTDALVEATPPAAPTPSDSKPDTEQVNK